MSLKDAMTLIDREREQAKLTPRQKQVCAFLCGGETTKGTALALQVSPKAVEYHRKNLYARLGINNLATLVKWAIRNGLTTL